MIQQEGQDFLDFSMTIKQDKKTFGTYKLTTKAPFVPPQYEEAVNSERQIQILD